jgi:hypothetical protein
MKFTEQGTIELAILLKTGNESAELEFYVKDILGYQRKTEAYLSVLFKLMYQIKWQVREQV